MPRSSTASPAANRARSSVPGSSRASSTRGAAPAKAAPVALALSDSDDDEASDAAADEDEDDEGGEYEIEKILGHRLHRDTGEITYKIRWKGYTPDDDTWEPEDHVRTTASDLTKKYWMQVKGRDNPKDMKALKAHNTKAKASRPRSDSPVEVEEVPSRAAKKARGSAEAAPADDSAAEDESEVEAEQRKAEALSRKRYDKMENWENECNVETLERSEAGELSAYIQFKDGSLLYYPASVAYKKCPQKTLKFYEQHLHFRRAPSNS